MTASRHAAAHFWLIALRPWLCGAAVVLGAFVVAGKNLAQAQAPPPPQARVIVIGEGSVRQTPDYAQVTSAVNTRAKTAQDATDANSKMMAAVTTALQNTGVEQKDIQTSRFSLQPVYVPQQPNTEPKLSGFAVSNQITVTVRQIADVGKIIDRLIAAGATDVGNVEFLHSDPSKALDQARQAAMADARRKAEVYAHASGLMLGRIVWITEDPGTAQPPLFSAMRAAAAPVPIAIGEDTLQARIAVGFDIEP